MNSYSRNENNIIDFYSYDDYKENDFIQITQNDFYSITVSNQHYLSQSQQNYQPQYQLVHQQQKQQQQQQQQQQRQQQQQYFEQPQYHLITSQQQYEQVQHYDQFQHQNYEQVQQIEYQPPHQTQQVDFGPQQAQLPQQIFDNTSIQQPSQSCVNEKSNIELKCEVCSGMVNVTFNHGAKSCEACKKFFVRSLKRGPPSCKNNNSECIITLKERSCELCRLNKCISVGMKHGKIPGKYLFHKIKNDDKRKN